VADIHDIPALEDYSAPDYHPIPLIGRMDRGAPLGFKTRILRALRLIGYVWHDHGSAWSLERDRTAGEYTFVAKGVDHPMFTVDAIYYDVPGLLLKRSIGSSSYSVNSISPNKHKGIEKIINTAEPRKVARVRIPEEWITPHTTTYSRHQVERRVGSLLGSGGNRDGRK
jgi:hypothetical protein